MISPPDLARGVRHILRLQTYANQLHEKAQLALISDFERIQLMQTEADIEHAFFLLDSAYQAELDQWRGVA